MRGRGRILAASLLAAVPAFAGDPVAPTWLTRAAAVPLPAYDKKVPAVVLLDEAEVVVDERGRVRRTLRRAVKVLNRDGRDQAAGYVPYATDISKVREVEGWLISPSGTVKRYGDKDWVDHLYDFSDVYDESRMKTLWARDEADVGAVFAFEAVVEEKPLFAHDTWWFQTRLPVVVSRYRLTLPRGGQAAGTVFNYTGGTAALTETTRTWELRDLPWTDRESFPPPLSQTAPWLAVSYETGSPEDALPRFAEWRDVSRWYEELAAPAGWPDPAIAAQAKALTRDATSDLERVQAVARYVQAIKYVSIQIGMGRFRPHSASDVLAKSYGDCKDKANLMRTMLKTLGIDAHLVLIYSGDPDRVRLEWPSPLQFNHCIIAIAAKGASTGGATVSVEGLGTLLVFDPTDEYTPLGELPRSHHGSLVVVATKAGTAPVRLSPPDPEAGLQNREIEASLDALGGIAAKVREVSAGAAAASARRAFRGERRTDAVKRIESWISACATAARIAHIRDKDDATSGRFTLELEFAAPAYGQLMQSRLLVFRPAVLGHPEAVLPSDTERTLPVVLEASALAETARIALPAGFTVDELPAPVALETPFGTYTAETKAETGALVHKRKLVLRRATVPPDQYAALKTFYEKMRAAEESPVVLVRN